MYSNRELSIEIDKHFAKLKDLIRENIRAGSDREHVIRALNTTHESAYNAVQSRSAKKEDVSN